MIYAVTFSDLVESSKPKDYIFTPNTAMQQESEIFRTSLFANSLSVVNTLKFL